MSACSGENKRRTKIVHKSLDPEWHQTLVYMKISKDEVKVKTLEVTVWDYDRCVKRLRCTWTGLQYGFLYRIV